MFVHHVADVFWEVEEGEGFILSIGCSGVRRLAKLLWETEFRSLAAWGGGSFIGVRFDEGVFDVALARVDLRDDGIVAAIVDGPVTLGERGAVFLVAAVVYNTPALDGTASIDLNLKGFGRQVGHAR